MDVHRRPPDLRFWQFAKKENYEHVDTRLAGTKDMTLLINPNVQLNDLDVWVLMLTNNQDSKLKISIIFMLFILPGYVELWSELNVLDMHGQWSEQWETLRIISEAMHYWEMIVLLDND